MDLLSLFYHQDKKNEHLQTFTNSTKVKDCCVFISFFFTFSYPQKLIHVVAKQEENVSYSLLANFSVKVPSTT